MIAMMYPDVRQDEIGYAYNYAEKKRMKKISQVKEVSFINSLIKYFKRKGIGLCRNMCIMIKNLKVDVMVIQDKVKVR
jgi:hypothetical protein